MAPETPCAFACGTLTRTVCQRVAAITEGRKEGRKEGREARLSNNRQAHGCILCGRMESLRESWLNHILSVSDSLANSKQGSLHWQQALKCASRDLLQIGDITIDLQIGDIYGIDAAFLQLGTVAHGKSPALNSLGQWSAGSVPPLRNSPLPIHCPLAYLKGLTCSLGGGILPPCQAPNGKGH